MSDSPDVAAAIGNVLHHVEVFLKEMHGVTARMGQHGLEGPQMSGVQWEAALALDGAMDELKGLTGKTGVGIE